jgi:conjugative transfer signal peptidase TraF
VPVGLYWIASAAPTTGELAVISLPKALSAFAAARGYLADTALLIKPVAAGMGDVVCRHDSTVSINGREVTHAETADGLGRALPRWTGCIDLAAGQVLVLSPAPDSFDGRYFGPIEANHVVGAAHPIWVNQTDGSPSAPPRQRRLP